MMNKKLFNVLLFAAGAAIGSVVTWKVVKTKYERILQEEIDSFKETYDLCMRGARDEKNSNDVEEDEDEFEDDDVFEADDSTIFDYHQLAGRYNKSGEAAENREEGEGSEEVPYINGPVVITPEDFRNNNYDHDAHCITYYSDGILANDWDEQLDIEETIGTDALEHFGDYVDDIVYVRNERLKSDYEVVRDTRTYTEVSKLNSPIRAYED